MNCGKLLHSTQTTGFDQDLTIVDCVEFCRTTSWRGSDYSVHLVEIDLHVRQKDFEPVM